MNAGRALLLFLALAAALWLSFGNYLKDFALHLSLALALVLGLFFGNNLKDIALQLKRIANEKAQESRNKLRLNIAFNTAMFTDFTLEVVKQQIVKNSDKPEAVKVLQEVKAKMEAKAKEEKEYYIKNQYL